MYELVGGVFVVVVVVVVVVCVIFVIVLEVLVVVVDEVVTVGLFCFTRFNGLWRTLDKE